MCGLLMMSASRRASMASNAVSALCRERPPLRAVRRSLTHATQSSRTSTAPTMIHKPAIPDPFTLILPGWEACPLQRLNDAPLAVASRQAKAHGRSVVAAVQPRFRPSHQVMSACGCSSIIRLLGRPQGASAASSSSSTRTSETPEWPTRKQSSTPSEPLNDRSKYAYLVDAAGCSKKRHPCRNRSRLRRKAGAAPIGGRAAL